MKKETIMKKIINVVVAILAIALSSCSKEIPEDPADRFVGQYKGTAKVYAEFFGISHTGTETVIFQISKTSDAGIRISGDFNSTGVVNGNTAVFNDGSEVTENGIANYSFRNVCLEGETISFTLDIKARISEEGLTIPCTGVIEVNASKTTKMTKTNSSKFSLGSASWFNSTFQSTYQRDTHHYSVE